jgi:hypothetical protein
LKIEPSAVNATLASTAARISSAAVSLRFMAVPPFSFVVLSAPIEASAAAGFAAREPAEERAQHEPALGCERQIGHHADDDAQRKTQHGSDGDRGSDAHKREPTPGASSRPLRGLEVLVEHEDVVLVAAVGAPNHPRQRGTREFPNLPRRAASTAQAGGDTGS